MSRSDYHHLYGRAAWKRARLAQLAAHPLCRMHLELGNAVAATVVDHITAHKGDIDNFLAAGNLQSLCKHCHDAHKQAQENDANGVLRGAGLTGRPLDLAHPWHRTPAPAADPGQGGGGKKSTPANPRTGRFPPFAEPRNG